MPHAGFQGNGVRQIINIEGDTASISVPRGGLPGDLRISSCQFAPPVL